MVEPRMASRPTRYAMLNHREPSADGPFPGICDSGASCSSMKVLDLSPSSLSFFGAALVYHSA